MDLVQIDYFTVFIAAIVNMVIGFFWYSKWLFGKTWQEITHVKEHKKMSIFYGFLISLVIAWFLAFFEGYLGVTTVTDGMFVGFCFWLGFVFTTQISSLIWGKGSVQLFFIDTGYKLLSFLVMSGIIAA